jgi:hypothetical protein
VGSDGETDEVRSLGPQLRRVGALVLVVAAGASLVFEQSPANEMLRTNAALAALKRTDSAVAVGLVVAAITALIELGSGALITFGLHVEEGAVQSLKRRMSAKHLVRSEKSGPAGGVQRAAGLGTDVAVALGLGAGLVTMRRHVADPDPSIQKDLTTTVWATGVIAFVSGLIGYLAGGGLANAAKVGLERPARWIIDYGTDTRFWVGLLVVGYGSVFGYRLGQRLLRRFRQTAAPVTAEPVTAAPVTAEPEAVLP